MTVLFVACGLLVITALVHSIGGEVLIFRRLPGDESFPEIFGSAAFTRRTVHATWHVAALFGLALAAILWRFSAGALGADERFVLRAIAVSLGASAALVGALTRGRHPGWAALLASAALCWLA